MIPTKLLFKVWKKMHSVVKSSLSSCCFLQYCQVWSLLKTAGSHDWVVTVATTKPFPEERCVNSTLKKGWKISHYGFCQQHECSLLVLLNCCLYFRGLLHLLEINCFPWCVSINSLFAVTDSVGKHEVTCHRLSLYVDDTQLYLSVKLNEK